MTIKVMIVDDSAVVRQTLSAILNDAPDIEVVKAASDPIIAKAHLEKMRAQNMRPDVIVLDIEMPRMDGITFLQQIMSTEPIPVVICSSLASKGCQLSIQALTNGAVDIITKPKIGLQGFLLETKYFFWQTIRNASKAKIVRPIQKLTSPVDLPHISETTDYVIAIGTSTGGTQALEFLLTHLPETVPGIVVVQHMPEKFTSTFAQRLNSISCLSVIEAKGGERIIPGRVLIAPGGHHMEIIRSGAQYQVKVFRGPAVNRHCPSVDVLFNSVAKKVGRNALGVIMTGMGDDGAQGLLSMHKAGAATMAQDEASSVVFGMPKEAIALGCVECISSLSDIPKNIIRISNMAT